MCGICGVVAFDGYDASPETVHKMMNVMAERGPDGQGMYAQNGATFGHRRLKIFDLSDRSQQPMIDGELGLSIVYNGAIYNYRELREELKGKGYRFFSDGDTEVVLKAYHAWGKRAPERFNGMFAFAVRHRDSGRVVMVRDRLGIKPLYYAMTPDRLAFASSLPALLAGGDIDTEIDPVALHYYMTFHAVVPAPRTMVRGVRKLPPATIMTVEPDGTTVEEPYWELTFGPANDAEEQKYGFDDWKALLRDEIDRAVARRMVADVPVGVLLSGGLDSSLIVGLLANSGQSGLNTFSIGFESAGGEKGDEFQYSDIVAERFGTVHHKIEVGSDRVLSSLEACVRAMSEPMVSQDCIGFFLLSREVAKHLKVVQSGQGADEVFAGYHWYPPMMEAKDPAAQYASVFFDGNHDDFARAVHPRFVGEDESSRFVAGHFAKAGAERPIDKALRLDTTVMLIDDPVKRVDNMTMAAGLEARVPFLDHELVALAARIPAEHKVADGGKGILKAIGREVIPREVIDRPKGYFPVPALKYLRGPYFEFVSEILKSPRARERETFNRDYVNQVLEAPDEHITPLRGSRLWQMALLEYWLAIHNL